MRNFSFKIFFVLFLGLAAGETLLPLADDTSESSGSLPPEEALLTSQNGSMTEAREAEFRFYNGCYVNASRARDVMSFVTEARNLYKMDREGCPGLRAGSLVWPETPAGQTAKMRCPDGDGVATWECDVTVPCWRGSPVITECVLHELNTKLQTTKFTSPEYNEYVTTSVARFLKSTGDYWITVETLKLAVETISIIGNMTLDHQILEETFLTLVDLAQLVISADRVSWDQLNGESVRSSTDLLSSLEKITTNILSSNETFHRRIVRENIVIERGEVSGDINFFPRSHTNSTTLSGHSLHLPYKALGKDYRGARFVVYYIKNDDQRFKIGQENLERSKSVTNGMMSDIMSATVRNHDGSLLSNVTIKFSINKINNGHPFCVFLNTSNSYGHLWSTEGCTERWTGDNQVECRCNHLTNFAVFMSLRPTPHIDLALTLISYIGCVSSILCLTLTLAVYFILWRYLKSDKSTLLVHLCICLAMGYTIFLAGIKRTENKIVCKIIAASLHYTFLTVFLNFFCQGVALLVSVKSMTSRSFLKHYLALIYAVPFVVVATTLAATGSKSHGTSHHCWLSAHQGVMWSFAGPALVVLSMNMLVLVVVIRTIQSSYGMMDKSLRARSVSVTRTLCFLTPIFGLSWVFGVLSLSSDELVFQYIFATLNSLQGLFIFILQCAIRKQVRESFVKRKRQIRSRSLKSSQKTVSTDSNVKREAETTL